MVDAIFTNCNFDGSLKTINQITTAELHIVQNLGDRFSLDDGIEHDFAGRRNIHVNGVGIPKKVMEVAKNFLIRSDQKDTQILR